MQSKVDQLAWHLAEAAGESDAASASEQVVYDAELALIEYANGHLDALELRASLLPLASTYRSVLGDGAQIRYARGLSRTVTLIGSVAA